MFPIPLDAPGRLAITARPRGNDWLADDVAGWKRAGVTLVVSLLKPDEEAELGLMGEATECTAVGLRFIRLPVADRGVPTNRGEFERVVSEVIAEVQRGGTAAVHCRQSVGRAALVVLTVLKRFGLTTAAAIARVSVARGAQVPETKQQAEWIAGWYRPHPTRRFAARRRRARTGRARLRLAANRITRPAMKTHRLARVAEVVREVAANTILFDIRDPRVKGVTVTRCEVSADLQHAKVYVSVMGSEKQQRDALIGLKNAAGFVQSRLADRLATRFLPVLAFVPDEGVKKSIEVARILAEERKLRGEVDPPAVDEDADSAEDDGDTEEPDAPAADGDQPAR